MEDFKSSKANLIAKDRRTPLCEKNIEGEPTLCTFDLSGEIEEENGVGAPFKKLSYATELKNIQKGGSNKIIVKPRVLTENLQDNNNNVQTLGGSITDVGQVFKLSSGIKNIDRIHLCLEATAGGAITVIDDFESYADTAALRVVWLSDDLTNTPNTLETTIVQEGTKAMKVEVINTASKSRNDEIVKTFGTNQDWSGFDGIQFQFRNDVDSVIELHIEDDNGDGSKQTITVSNNGVYEFINLNFSDFIPVGAVPADLTIIKKIKFIFKTAKTGSYYVDIMELFSASAFGTVDLEIYNFGTNPTPTSLGTPLKTETFDLQSGKIIYEIPINVTGLTPNDFIGIVLTNPSTATVKVFGKNGSDLYENGFAFDSSDNGTNIASTGSGDDLCFSVFALDKAIFNGIRFVANGPTGEGKINVFINDNASGKGKSALFLGETFLGRQEIDFPTKTQTNLGVKMTSDELIDIRYEDDAGSLVTKLQATVYFTFINRPING